MDETRTAPHSAATRPEEALPDDAFELVGAGWREHRPALRRPGWRQRLARLPLLPLCLLLLLVLGCLCAPWLANHDPAEFYLADRNTPPGSRFFFGTDSLGRDIYSIIWFGGRASLLIGLLSAAVITVLGVAYGCLSGIAPARTDALLMRLVELVQSIPVLLVLLLAVSLLGPQNALSIALLIGVTGWFALARIVRGEVRQIRHSEYILASRCMGGSFGWIMRRHLVPNVVSAILFVVISAVSTSIAMESTLSFLGLGLPVDELSWGSMLALADKVVEAVKSGAIRKFVVMAGCDGRMKSRDYYADFARALPEDTVILTAGCAKYRYNKLPLGDIQGIPRVLDAGQCNDSYSLAVIALKLKEVFQLNDINELPIVYNIAWYEQKAVIVLLALLSLGVKHIHLGPTLPAFLSPNVAKVLVEQFGIGGITSPDEDLKRFGIL